MKMVGTNEPGMNIWLHPNKTAFTYFEVCEDGKQLLLTGTRVERIDKPSFKLQEVMTMQSIYPPGYNSDLGFGRQELPENEPYFLIVETEEVPSPPRVNPVELLKKDLQDLNNPLGVVLKHLESLDLNARRQLLEMEAANLGIALAPPEVRLDLEEEELTDGRIVAGIVTKPIITAKPLPGPRKETR